MINGSKGAPNPRWSRQRLRRSLYRGLLILVVGLSNEAVPPTQRCGSAFPLAADKTCDNSLTGGIQ
jgi:hypothetical protein